jgi:signal transduction histidine kinase/GAF domain-containing protein
MEAKTQTLSRETSAIVERVARIVSSVRGTNPDYAHLAGELELTIPFDLFGIVLLRHDRQAVRVTACQREGDTWKSHYRQHPFEGSMLEQVLLQPVLTIRDYPLGVDGPPAESGDALSGSPYLRATLIAPLLVGERILGTLELGSTVIGAYADETLQRLISAVVRVLAAAIERTQLGGSVAIQDRQREALKHVSSALTTEMDLPTILNRIVVGIGEVLQVASAIVTFDMRTEQLRLGAQFGLNADILTSVIEHMAGLSERSILGATLRRRQPCVSQDIGVDERYPESQSFHSQLGVRSMFSYPLVTGDKIFGALLLCSQEPGGFTPLKADILSLFASQATIAIYNGILFEAARKRRRFQEAIEQLEKAHVGIGEMACKDTSDTLAGNQAGVLCSEFASNSARVQALFAQVCQETEQTFGIRFSSLLRFVSDHLLTQSERDLQTIGYAALESDVPIPPGSLSLLPSSALLLQAAEDALARARLFGNVGAALAVIPPRLYEQLAQNTTDAQFLIDLEGHCLYMNPAAEVWCGRRLDVVGGMMLTLEEVFAGLLPRARNVNELRLYLRKIAQPVGPNARQDQQAGENSSPYEQVSLETEGLRCVLAAEPVRQPLKDAQTQQDAAFSDDILDELPSDQTFTPLQADTRQVYASLDYQHTPSSAPSDHHYQLTRTPLFDKEGRLVAYALQTRDVTEQVRDEMNKSVLLSSVSHDLRTPLTTIKAGVTGLLQPGVVWDEQARREVLEEIDVETDHLETLVTAIIEMSRIEMGALVLEKEWCDIVELVYVTISHLERVLGGRKVHTRFQPQLPLIQADYVQLERVFHNLLENAARHSPEQSEILLTLAVEREMLRAQVIDQGPGIAEEERERIFKTFYALDTQGSGLGLAICRGIVEAHGGRIWVERAPEEIWEEIHNSQSDKKQRKQTGSCFVFVLPLHS